MEHAGGNIEKNEDPLAFQLDPRDVATIAAGFPEGADLLAGRCLVQAAGLEAAFALLQRANIRLEFFDLLTAGDVSQSITYKNSKGEEWTSTIVDVLNHVVIHSAYHRGQIASHMRANGQTPAYTDFIHGVRQGLVK